MVDPQQKGEPARITEECKQAGPCGDMGRFADPADGMADLLIVEHVPRALFLGYEMHPSSMTQHLDTYSDQQV
jgi:hypothetical protein